ncbi:MAG: glycoside hydrolase family 6 protein [Candidatus Doudnabacteria bacterium]|nr:glycoside hydrolase family 6 protein [Candidatus Doudnabacteria bacterium]
MINILRYVFRCGLGVKILVVLVVSGSVLGGLRNFEVEADWQSLEIWWPVRMAQVSGQQPFKAVVQGRVVETYHMFWQVDGGQLNQMYNSYHDYPHKEAIVDVSGWNWKGLGPYRINFIAYDYEGKKIGEAESSLSLQQMKNQNSSALVSISPAVGLVSARTGDSGLYEPKRIMLDEVMSSWKVQRGQDVKYMEKLKQPTAVWFGEWNKNIKADVEKIVTAAKTENKIPVLVIYNIPIRDCGGFSAGGSSSAEKYLKWVTDFSSGLNGKSIIILEPDALALSDCLDAQLKNTRYEILKKAVEILKTKYGTNVYLDAGHPNWVSASEMADRLKRSGIGSADGFSLNVSNFIETGLNAEYGQKISSYVGGKHFVIDTGRNGLGALGSEWCNPSGRALGNVPTLNTGKERIDAYLWIKPPGESDGSCNGGPGPGVFWPEYALGLAKLSK